MRRSAAVVLTIGMLGPLTTGQAQVFLQGGVRIGRTEHHVRDAGTLSSASGTLVGGVLTVAVRERFQIQAEVWGGRLSTAASPSLEDHDLAEVQLIGAFKVRPWLMLEAGPVLRNYSNELARQHWTTFRAGAAARLPLATEHIRGVLRGYWMPIVSVNDLPRPEIALAASAGLEWRLSRVTVGMMYTLERYDFPTIAGARRLEQLSSLQLGAGLHWPR